MKKRIVLFIAGVLVLGGLGYAAYRVAKQDDSASTEFRIAYMDSSYERPPDKSDFVVSSDEDRSFLDDVLKSILDGKDNLSDEEKSIGILKYVCSSMRESPNRGSATKMIKDGYALCGGKSQVFVTLCRRAGMPSRYVGSMYMKMMGSHAISEVFYDGNWHFYDATLGVFFYSNPDYDKQGRIVSFHEVVADPYRWAAVKVAPKAGAGVYDAPVKEFALTRMARRGQ